ncbi:hypothetical protein BSLA_02r1589 [Burkholderia stabilis]|nr:hypothetical protein BSLA_02r1589 [Burkholderia stabilis]
MTACANAADAASAATHPAANRNGTESFMKDSEVTGIDRKQSFMR